MSVSANERRWKAVAGNIPKGSAPFLGRHPWPKLLLDLSGKSETLENGSDTTIIIARSTGPGLFKTGPFPFFSDS